MKNRPWDLFFAKIQPGVLVTYEESDGELTTGLVVKKNAVRQTAKIYFPGRSYFENNPANVGFVELEAWRILS